MLSRSYMSSIDKPICVMAYYHFANTQHPSPIILFFVIEGFRVAAVQFYL